MSDAAASPLITPEQSARFARELQANRDRENAPFGALMVDALGLDDDDLEQAAQALLLLRMQAMPWERWAAGLVAFRWSGDALESVPVAEQPEPPAVTE